MTLPVTTRVLSARQLNRATLARQLLLERAQADPVTAIEHLVGLQAQTPQTWYVGLWSRLAGFDPGSVGAALEDRRLVRVPLMRSTIHLVSAVDAQRLRPLVDPVIERATLGVFGRRLAGVDRAELVAAARELVEREPRTAAELGRGLADRFPEHDPDALAQGARMWLPMVQVPPRGVWKRSGQARQASMGSWLAAAPPVDGAPTVADLVRRYLAAFGPASARDVQLWCGLTRLAEVLDEMRPGLVAFRAEDGRELFDLPDAPRPDPDVPAPARFLYDFDNLLLSHADRSRIVTAGYTGQGFGPPNQEQPSSLLVDGTTAATWKVTRARGRATLTVRPFRRFTPAERADVEAEGAALLAFLHPRDAPDLRLPEHEEP